MSKEKDEYSLKEIYEQMELELIASFYRNLVKHQQEQIELGFSWEMWQSAMLRNLETYRKETLKITQSYSKEIEQSIKEVLNKSYSQGEQHTEDNIEITQDKLNTGPVGKRPPAENKFFGMNKKKLNALVESTNNDFKDVNKAIYRKVNDVYRQTIYKTEYQMSGGAISLGKAIDLATNDFLNKGIDCIVYKNGRHVNVATYAEMALRTASQRATFLGEGSKRDEYGVYTIMVSVHANACEMCLPWQGEILIDDVFSHPSKEYIENNKQYKLLSKAIKNGLLHPNCRHTLINYIEGVTRKISKLPDEKVLENYYLEQKQRKLENKIRILKRLVKGTVDKDDKKMYSMRLNKASKEMKHFLETNKQFKRNSRREKIYEQI